MSVLIFLAVLFVLVLVHELGHFAVAKWTGMRVDEFGIGFPPKLFGIKKGETEYTFNLFPIGGFVKIFGEDGDGEAKESSTVAATPDPRSFTGKSKWAQSAVLVAGVTMNILFAWFLIAVAFNIGVQSVVTEEEAGPDAQLVISGVLPSSPAETALIKGGSVIKAVEANGETLDTFTPTSFSSFIAAHPEDKITIFYTYQGEPQMVQVTPQKGIIEQKQDQAALGVSLVLIDTLERGFFESLTDSFMHVVISMRDIVVGVGTLVYQAVRSEADFSQVAGPIGIVGMVGEASAYGITALLMFTAYISLNLAVINILPFPALDGGRLLFVIIEAIKGSPITPRYAARANMIGFVLLIALMIAVTWNDIARLL